MTNLSKMLECGMTERNRGGEGEKDAQSCESETRNE